MAKLYLAFLLHFNQPINQDREVLREISNECYRPVFGLFNDDLDAKFSISITDSLLSLFKEEGMEKETIDQLSMARQKGNIEVLHTGAYYPILPLLDPGEIRRQIEVDIDFKKKDLAVDALSGFFPPELCCDDNLIEILRQQGFKWTILDDQLFEQNGIAIPEHEISCAGGLHVFARSSFWSNILSQGGPRGRDFVRQMDLERRERTRDYYKIIALAGETFGHRHRLFHRVFFEEMFNELQSHDNIKSCQVSDLLCIPSLSKRKVVSRTDGAFRYFPASSWATTPKNAARGDPYPHWKSRGNPIHEKLWELSDLIQTCCRGVDFTDQKYKRLRDLLDPAFYSLQYFWASIHYWNSGLIYKGIDLQMRALYEYCDVIGNNEALETGQRIYTQLLREIQGRDRLEAT